MCKSNYYLNEVPPLRGLFTKSFLLYFTIISIKLIVLNCNRLLNKDLSYKKKNYTNNLIDNLTNINLFLSTRNLMSYDIMPT